VSPACRIEPKVLEDDLTDPVLFDARRITTCSRWNILRVSFCHYLSVLEYRNREHQVSCKSKCNPSVQGMFSKVDLILCHIFLSARITFSFVKASSFYTLHHFVRLATVNYCAFVFVILTRIVPVKSFSEFDLSYYIGLIFCGLTAEIFHLND